MMKLNEHWTEEERAWVSERIKVMTEEKQIKLWAKFVNHQYAAWAALFELVTGRKPPKMKEIASIISGH